MSRTPRPILATLAAALVAAGCVGVVAATVLNTHPLAGPGDETAPSQQVGAVLPASGAPLLATPAGQALTDIARQLPDALPGYLGRLSARGHFSAPTPLRCPIKDKLVYDGWSWFASREGKEGALTVTALTAGPGYGQTLLRESRSALLDCGAMLTTGSGGAFAATANGLSVRGWAIGDVALFLVADPGVAKRLDELQASVDAVARRTLAAACADLAPSDAAYRNPYLGSTFTGNVASVAFELPPISDTPKARPGTTWSWAPPEPVPYPQFAVTGADGQTNVPSLVNPDALIAPAVAATAAPPSVAPYAQMLDRFSTTMRIADPIGPGCGWKFLGVRMPELGYQDLIDQVDAQAAQQAAAMTRSAAESLIDQVRWARETSQTQEARSQWEALEDYRRAREAAQAAITRAQQDWATAIATPTPSPTPTPTPTPTMTPVPTPEAPTPAPVPTTAPTDPPAPATTDPAQPVPAGTPTEGAASR